MQNSFLYRAKEGGYLFNVKRSLNSLRASVRQEGYRPGEAVASNRPKRGRGQRHPCNPTAKKGKQICGHEVAQGSLYLKKPIKATNQP